VEGRNLDVESKPLT